MMFAGKDFAMRSEATTTTTTSGRRRWVTFKSQGHRRAPERWASIPAAQAELALLIWCRNPVCLAVRLWNWAAVAASRRFVTAAFALLVWQANCQRACLDWMHIDWLSGSDLWLSVRIVSSEEHHHDPLFNTRVSMAMSPHLRSTTMLYRPVSE